VYDIEIDLRQPDQFEGTLEIEEEDGNF